MEYSKKWRSERKNGRKMKDRSSFLSDSRKLSYEYIPKGNMLLEKLRKSLGSVVLTKIEIHAVLCRGDTDGSFVCPMLEDNLLQTQKGPLVGNLISDSY